MVRAKAGVIDGERENGWGPVKRRPPEGLRGAGDSAEESDSVRVLEGMIEGLLGAGPALIVVHGEQGLGKFRMAERAAERVQAQQPRETKVLRMPLHGMPTGNQSHYLELLGQLREPVTEFPWKLDVSELRDLYREVTRQFPVILLLRDIEGWDQVEQLLPDGRNAVVVATGPDPCDMEMLGPATVRNWELAERPCAERCYQIFCAAMTDRQGVPRRPLPSREDVDPVMRWCRNHPLALKLAGALYGMRDDWLVRDLLTDAAWSRHPHPEPLSPGEVIDVLLENLYAHSGLTEEHQLLFRLISLPGTPSIEARTAAALLDPETKAPEEREVRRVTGLLHDLEDRGLLSRPVTGEEADPERFPMVPLIRDFAGEKLSAQEQYEEPGPYSRSVAEQRLIAAYSRRSVTLRSSLDGKQNEAPGFASPKEAREWLALEKDAILHMLQKNEHSAMSSPRELIRALCDYFVVEADLHGLGRVQTIVASLRPQEEVLLREVDLALGIVARRAGLLAEARARLEPVVAMFRRAQDDALGEAWALRQLGVTLHQQGQFASAEETFWEARRPLEAMKRGDREAWVLQSQGAVHTDMGHFDLAENALLNSLNLHREYKNARGAAWAQQATAALRLRQGRLDGVEDLLTEAHEQFVALQDSAAQGWTKLGLARYRLQLGDVERAVGLLAESREIHQRHQDRHGLAWTAFTLARCHRTLGRTGAADSELTRSMSLFTDMGNRFGEVWCWYESAFLPVCDDPVERIAEAAAAFREIGDRVGSARAEAELARRERAGAGEPAAHRLSSEPPDTAETEPVAGHLEQPGAAAPLPREPRGGLPDVVTGPVPLTANGPYGADMAVDGPGGPAARPLPGPRQTSEQLAEVDNKKVNFWIREREQSPDEPLVVGQRCTGVFRVGDPVPGNLAGDGPGFPSADTPLATRWYVRSTTVALGIPEGQEDGPVRVEMAQEGDDPLWLARFDLDIPVGGDSEERLLCVVPRSAEEARIEVTVEIGVDVYRELTVELQVTDEAGGVREPEGCAGPAEPGSADRAVQERTVHEAPGVESFTERQCLTADHADLHVQEEYKPPGHLIVTFDKDGLVRWQSFGYAWAGPYENGHGACTRESGGAEGSARKLREILDKFREGHGDTIDDIPESPEDIGTVLSDFKPVQDWRSPPPHRDFDAWSGMATSSEIRELAHRGKVLFEELFPETVREQVGKLAPGSRLTINRWDLDVGHIPWGLLYRDLWYTVKPDNFLGMRVRIEDLAHRVNERSRSLGASDQVKRAHILYWGTEAGDDTAEETGRHMAALQHEAMRSKPVFLPSPDVPDACGEVQSFLREPAPRPVGLLYFYCQCVPGTGADPMLLFSNSPDLRDKLELMDIDGGPLADQPLVFVNACGTRESEPGYTALLERRFFARQCRAFIGTECKVPVRFAARFASVFLHFLHMRVDGHPTPAGEAFAQTRKFFWDRYRNIGGLFYSYVNDYSVFLASRRDVAAMR